MMNRIAGKQRTRHFNKSARILVKCELLRTALRRSSSWIAGVFAGFGWESRPGESHPEALAEPYVTLSRHTAPIKEPPRIVAQGANRCGERRETAATHRLARRT